MIGFPIMFGETNSRKSEKSTKFVALEKEVYSITKGSTVVTNNIYTPYCKVYIYNLAV